MALQVLGTFHLPGDNSFEDYTLKFFLDASGVPEDCICASGKVTGVSVEVSPNLVKDFTIESLRYVEAYNDKTVVFQGLDYNEGFNDDEATDEYSDDYSDGYCDDLGEDYGDLDDDFGDYEDQGHLISSRLDKLRNMTSSDWSYVTNISVAMQYR